FEVIPIIKEKINDDKKEYKVIFMMRDIFGEIETQRDQISKDFLHYQFLKRSISDGMLIVDNGIIIDVNNVATILWHYEKDELINKPLSLIIPDASQYIDNASTIKGNSIRFVGIRKDKTRFNGALQVQAFDNLNKRSMVYIVRDLTYHIAVERLMETQSDFTTELFDIQPNMIAVFNENHILTRCNKLFLDFFGYTSIEEAIHNIGEISSKFLDADDNTFITSANKNNWFILPIEHQNIKYKVGMNDKTGSCNIFNLNSTLMENETNIFYVVSFTNITRTTERLKSFKETNNLLQPYSDDLKSTIESNMITLAQYHKLATIGTMIGFITHQWKQPLNAIGLIAQNTEDILEDEDFDKEELAEMMQSIMNHVMFMSETMENFKNFFKPEDVSVPFKVSLAIKSIMALLIPVLKKSNIEVIYDMPAQCENLKVFGFTNNLKQVIMNIVVNGKDSILQRKENEPELRGQIAIKVDNHNNEHIIITITDNGTGLSEEALIKIFEMHWTTKGSQGTGIGMYMAQMIIEKMNGSLQVKNREDGEKGAQIVLSLPIHNGQ
ncbi:MAG: PAS domain-containing protein, partial [Mucispirillum sp.]|nr:PAS domain-containing protein [Mucispirillum sp.]